MFVCADELGVGGGGGCKKVSGGGLGNIWTDVFATTSDLKLTKQFSSIQTRNCHERQLGIRRYFGNILTNTQFATTSIFKETKVNSDYT